MNKKSIFRDKRAAKLISIWWFFVIGLVGVAIVVGVVMFYSAEADVRQVESSILYDNLARCLTEQGSLIEGVFDTSFDVFSKCNLNKEIVESGDLYFKVEISDSDGKLLKEIKEGSSFFEQDCSIQQKVIAKKFPKCTDNKENVFYYENGEKKTGTLHILTASNKKGIKVD